MILIISSLNTYTLHNKIFFHRHTPKKKPFNNWIFIFKEKKKIISVDMLVDCHLGKNLIRWISGHGMHKAHRYKK